MNGNKKIEEIKIILYDPRNNLFKPEENHYKPTRIGNAFSSNYIEYKSNRDKDKSLSSKEYLDKIRPYLSGIINDYKTQGEWKIKLTMAINFFSSKDSEKIRTIYTLRDNTKDIIDIETDEIIEEFLGPLLQRYQERLEESMKGSEFIFDSVNSLYYKLHKISLNRGESYRFSWMV